MTATDEFAEGRLPIVQAGDPVLRQPARPVEVDELGSARVQRLIDAMIASVSGVGVGLAAPQVGVGLRIAVIEDPPEYHEQMPDDLLEAQGRTPVERYVLINPELTVVDDTPAEWFEGCLSVDGYRAIVPRASSVHVRALDRDGRPFELDATGWHARILQHEIDHLDGCLYVDRMLTRTLVDSDSYSERWGGDTIDHVKAVFHVD
ncbi:MAG: peptide deformylase [Acidimicrobiales bacterium]